jgi:rhodanese-related sulfurtransferase
MKKVFASFALVCLASAASAGPAVVAHSACPHYAVDIEAFATCEGDRVAMPDGIRLVDDLLLAEAAVPATKRTFASLYVDAPGAYALKQRYPESVVLVDIRSSVELGLTGHAQGVDMNVPYYELVQPLVWSEPTGGWTMAANPRFGAQLDERLQTRGVSHDTVVMLICRTGDGTARAADELTLRGYRSVVSVVDGYEGDVGADGQRALNGWKNAGLPWTARADATLIARVR